ncbi:hypothetical protein [Bordetella sp. LUAb4]|uniref:hypothetical protein n=1 Tax=Bordetella sp. LUAb4 TaxID=2843195 RepID=UPI00351CEFC4
MRKWPCADETPIGRLAIEAADELELDVAGVDIIVDKAGSAYVLEINPEPDATYEQGLLRSELPFAIAQLLARRTHNQRDCHLKAAPIFGRPPRP